MCPLILSKKAVVIILYLNLSKNYLIVINVLLLSMFMSNYDLRINKY